MKTIKPFLAMLLMLFAGCTGTATTKAPATAQSPATTLPPDQSQVIITPPPLKRPLTEDDLQKLDGSKPTDISDLPPFADTENLRAVYKLIRHIHITTDATDTELYYGALKGMVKALNDPYTHFLDPKEAKASQEGQSGRFTGVGMNLDTRDGTLKVTGTKDGSPAREAGIRAGDVVIEVDGKPTQGEDPQETIQRIRGEDGTRVTVTVFRKGAPKNPIVFRLRRDTINTPSVKWKMVRSGGKVIAHIIVEQFGDDTRALWGEAVEATLAAKATGVILDLRDDGGGRLDAAGVITCSWVPKGPFTILGGRKDTKDVEPLLCRGDAPLENMPTVVLVNGRSASASEITAGALQDYGKARVIGETTYGKGCGQSVVRFRDGAQLIIVSFLWYTPQMRSIHKKGITPDEVLKAEQDDRANGKDVQLDRGLQFLVTGR